LAAAQAIIPALELQGGGYITIQGPLAFEPLFTTTALVSVATAAQPCSPAFSCKSSAKAECA
jgi:hypothetical protein